MPSFALIGLAFLAIPSAGSVDYVKEVAPVLKQECLSCHSTGSKTDLSSRQSILEKKLIVPGNPDASPLYTAVKNGSMPPGKRLTETDLATIRSWIAQSVGGPTRGSGQLIAAVSPSPPPASGPAAEMENVRRIRERILAHVGQTSSTKSQPYKLIIANTTVGYEMVPIKGGEFEMGSPASDPKAGKDEQPQHRVHVDDFFMQAHEVTWDEYRLFMFANQAGEIANKDAVVDGVSRPTRPYVEMSFGMGINGFPAISMTQHAANKYAEWLSSKTGEFYRLPTEAEWEYACRAGTNTPYSFGPDTSRLGDYAVFSGNSGGKYAKVESKKPNAWGLYDMLGNVMEWTLDAYEPYKPGVGSNPRVKPTKPYPITARGGSWNDPADQLRCTSRVASDPSWKQQDPQLPKSIWYETDAQWLGFRLVRPAKVPSAEEMFGYWNNGVEHDEQ